MSSMSPETQADGSGADGRSPNSTNLDFLKNISEKRTNRDGKAPKRRGPKPDSKPALTRRQELNRQAQRTHRERKELYIKALEDEVLRLKEIYSSVAQDREKLAEENRLLKDVLIKNGLNVPDSRSGDDDKSNPSAGAGFGGSLGGFSPGQMSQGTAPSTTSNQASNYQGMTGSQGGQYRSIAQAAEHSQVDVEQAGIDFVLSLEKPCMAHLPFLLDRASGPSAEPCGHALMASCPPAQFQKLTPDRPFGESHTSEPAESGQNQGTWDISKADLSTLLDLSQRLDLDGEITPVMAWGMIMSHPQFASLTEADLGQIADELRRKVRCYGFGAVMEDFELKDAFESVCSNRIEAVAC